MSSPNPPATISTNRTVSSTSTGTSSSTSTSSTYPTSTTLLTTSYTHGASLLPFGILHTPHHIHHLTPHPTSSALLTIFINTLLTSSGRPWSFHPFPSSSPAAFHPVLRNHHTIGAVLDLDCRLDAADDVGREVGVDTVYMRAADGGGRTYVGTNMLAVGIAACIRGRAGMAAAVVVGSGRDARAAVYALRNWCGVATVHVVCVGESNTVQGVEDIEGEVAVVVGCIPDTLPIDGGERRVRRVVEEVLMGRKARDAVFVETGYWPRVETELVKCAVKGGWEVVLGAEVMVQAAVAMCVLWTEGAVREEVIEDGRRELRARMAAA